MITLRASNLHWIKDEGDDPADLCAHSGVDFRIDEKILVAPGDGNWSVSAAAVYLLRTLWPWQSKDGGGRYGENLFPCCGHAMYALEGRDDVVIVGCPNGIDFDVIRVDDNILVTDKNGQTDEVRFADWRDAVCAFSDQIQGFYAASWPKQPCGGVDAEGFQKLLVEWSRRRSSAPTLN